MARDLELVERLARLHPAVVADCLDRLGLRGQVLAPHIRPLDAGMRRRRLRSNRPLHRGRRRARVAATTGTGTSSPRWTRSSPAT